MMDIIKKNVLAVVCAGVAVLAIVGTFLVPKFFDFSNVNASEKTYTELEKLKQAKFNKPSVTEHSTEAEPLGQAFPSEGTIKEGVAAVEKLKAQVNSTVAKIEGLNKKKPLVMNALPNGRGQQLGSFRDAYYATIAGFRAQLNAGLAPTPNDEKDAHDAKEKELIGNAGGNGPQGIPPGRQQQIQKELADFDLHVSENLKRDYAERYTMYLASDLEMRPDPSGQRISNTNTGVYSFDYHPGIPLPDAREFPSLVDVWAAQLGIWIQEDVVEAIRKTNEKPTPSTQPSTTGRVNVRQAVIKRLVRINIPKEYLIQSSTANPNASGQYTLPIVESVKNQSQAPPPGANGMPSEASSTTTTDAGTAGAGTGATKAVNVSMTGRVSNATFDVMHFSVVVDIDSRYVETFVANLSNDRFLTVLKADMKGVDLERAWQRGYDYGNSPVVTLQLQCEAIFLRDWTVGGKDPSNPSAPRRPALMPASVQALLGVPKDAPAGGESTGG
jgi:hypothetical protein